MVDVWELIKQGHFDEACKAADQEYEKSKNIFPLRNKVYALLQLQKFEEVISLTNFLIAETGGQTDSDFIFLGIGLWSNKKYSEAVQQWLRAENCKYTDAGGGIEVQVLLFFAAIKLKDIKLKARSEQKIQKILKSKGAKNWPGPLGHYLLDNLSEKLFSSVSQQPILRERQLCQAYFTIAIKHLENNDIKSYLFALEMSISQGISSFLESFYYLSKMEIDIISDSQHTVLHQFPA